MTSLTEEQARAAIAAWYSLFNVASRGDVRAIQEQVLTADYESAPAICRGNAGAARPRSRWSRTCQHLPDMKFEIKEVLVAGDHVIVRGEVTGTPAGELFGVPHTAELQDHGRRYPDHQGRQDRRTYHMENWLSAIGQLRAK